MTGIFGVALQGSSQGSLELGQASVSAVKRCIRYGTTASLLLEQICPVGITCRATLAVSRAGEKEASFAIVLASCVGSVTLEVVNGKLGLSTSLAFGSPLVWGYEKVKSVLDAVVPGTVRKIHNAFDEETESEEVESAFTGFGRDLFGDKMDLKR